MSTSLRRSIRFPDGLELVIRDCSTQLAVELYKNVLDPTPAEGDLKVRAAALLGFIEEKNGSGARGTINPTQALVLIAKYGQDAVQKAIDDRVITGV